MLEDQELILKLIKQSNEAEKNISSTNSKVNNSVQESPRSRLRRLKTSNLPSLKILYTNADQLTTVKKIELIKSIEVMKPLIVAVCEIKPKNGKERTIKDYEIPNFNLHSTNLDNNIGRGIAIYTHNSISKSLVQIMPDSIFQEVCLIEMRLRGGDLFLFGCIYRSPTVTSNSSANNAYLNKLLNIACLKKYSHVCIVGDFNFKHKLE